MQVYINYINLCLCQTQIPESSFQGEKKTPTESKEDTTCKFKI